MKSLHKNQKKSKKTERNSGYYIVLKSQVVIKHGQVTDVLSLSWLLLICYQGQPDPLNSAFHLTYNMVLNLLRVEEVNPEIMLEKSFCQFQNYASVPGMIDSMYLSLIHFFQVSALASN